MWLSQAADALMEIATSVRYESSRAQALAGVAGASALVGGTMGDRKRLEEAAELARTIRIEEARCTALEGVVAGYSELARAGRWQGAPEVGMELAQKITSPSVRAVAYCRNGSGWYAAGAPEKGSHAFILAEADARGIHGDIERSNVVAEVAVSLASAAGEWRKAELLLRAQAALPLIVGPFSRGSALAAVATALFRLGRRKEGRETLRSAGAEWESVTDPYQQVVLGCALVEAHSDGGGKEAHRIMESCREVAQTVEDAYFSSLLVAELAHSAQMLKRESEASSLLAAGEELAAGVQDDFNRAMAQAALSTGFYRTAQVMKARELLWTSIAGVKAIGDEYYRALALSRMPGFFRGLARGRLIAQAYIRRVETELRGIRASGHIHSAELLVERARKSFEKGEAEAAVEHALNAEIILAGTGGERPAAARAPEARLSYVSPGGDRVEVEVESAKEECREVEVSITGTLHLGGTSPPATLPAGGRMTHTIPLTAAPPEKVTVELRWIDRKGRRGTRTYEFPLGGGDGGGGQ